MPDNTQALLAREDDLLKAMALRKELATLAQSFKGLDRLDLVAMQLECACKSIVLARNTYDELVNFANYATTPSV